MDLYSRYGKRVLDVAVASSALLATAPVLAAAAVAIKLDSPGPVLFTQDRLGRDGRIFEVLKLRTMTDRERTPNGEVSLCHPEITPVGRVLRRLKIDELPQLFNILRGDMSLVGPRPGLPRMREELDAVGEKRLKVRPGLTGLAQVNGNIHLSWPERWRYDAAYANGPSLAQDVAIVLKTVPVVVFGDGHRVRPPERVA